MPHYHSICVGGRIHKKHYSCAGGQILLQKGGPGVGSSYDSPEEYHQTTCRGLSDDLKSKLNNLIVKPLTRKPKNIQFSI